MVRASEDVLRGAGLGVTTQRLAVLDALAEFPHASRPPGSRPEPATTTTTWSAAHAGGQPTSTAFVGARPCLTPTDDAGYVADEAEVLFRGLCPDCQQEDSRGNKELFA